MKSFIIFLNVFFVQLAYSKCNEAKLNPSDEILFVTKCSDFCVLKALSTDAREYVLVKNDSIFKKTKTVFFLDSSNTLQNSYSETSDFFKIYSSAKNSPNKANIIKYDKISKVLEIIDVNSLKIQPESHKVYTCLN